MIIYGTGSKLIYGQEPGPFFYLIFRHSSNLENFDKISKVLKKNTLFFIDIFSEMWYYEL